MSKAITLDPQINLEEKNRIIFVSKKESSQLKSISESFPEAIEISSLLNAWIIANQGSIANTKAVIIEFDETDKEQIHGIKNLIDQTEKLSIPIVVYAPSISSEHRARILKMGVNDVRTESFNADSFNQWMLYAKYLKSHKETFKKPNGLTIKTYKVGFMKRSFDIFVSLGLILLLAPIMVAIAIAVRLESRGPIIYVSKRAGRGYKIFNFYKFRSMRSGADKEVKDLWHKNEYNGDDDANSVFFKVKNDPRITKIGSFIRSTSLDELPQLFNVLKGDMSIVGNRPLPLYEASQLTNDQIAKRFLAPAGITGLWQVTKRGKAELTPEERIQLDIDYANNYSFSYDLFIIFKTFPALLQQEKV